MVDYTWRKKGLINSFLRGYKGLKIESDIHGFTDICQGHTSVDLNMMQISLLNKEKVTHATITAMSFDIMGWSDQCICNHFLLFDSLFSSLLYIGGYYLKKNKVVKYIINQDEVTIKVTKRMSSVLN